MNENNENTIMKYKEYLQINAALRRDLEAIYTKLDEIIEAEDITELNDRYTDVQFLINNYHRGIITALYLHYLRKKTSLEV